MDVKLTETPEAFALPEWVELSSNDARRHIFATSEWSRLWWLAFGAGKQLMVLTFMDPHPIGLAALMVDETDDGRRLRFLGGDDLTDYLGPVAAGEVHLPAIADALLEFLCGHPGWDYFDAKYLPVPFGFAEWLVESADRRGMPFSMDQEDSSLILGLPDSKDAYFSSLPQKKRHELKRKLRRFEREVPDAVLRRSEGGTLSLDLVTFEAMHRRSEGDKGSFMDAKRSRFFRDVAEDFEPRGWLSLDLLESEGVVLAVNFSFVYEGDFYLYNSAYDLGRKGLSPGLVIVSRLIERCIDEGIKRFDFLRGTERYKFDLGAQPLPLHSVRIRPLR